MMDTFVPESSSITRRLKTADSRSANDTTKVINFNEELDKTLHKKKSYFEKKQLKLQEELEKTGKLPTKSIAPTVTGPLDPPGDGDDCGEEDDEDGLGPALLGTSHLISNLEKYYASKYVTGYKGEEDDDFIDDSDFEKKGDKEEEALVPEFMNEFYVHQGTINLISKAEIVEASPGPPRKKQKVAHTEKQTPTKPKVEPNKIQ